MPETAVEAVRNAALWFETGTDGLAPLIDSIGDASVVLIGEASHGTHEFYRIRADLTAALIEQKGFNIVAAEADWPDAYRVNRWMRLGSEDPDPSAALASFTRFPRWMWRNDVVVDFVQWLRAANANRVAAQRVGFYGLDLYSLHSSMEAVLVYLDASTRLRHGKLAIGVVYKPETERASHYFRARVAEQFDAVIHVDTTTALNPLERWSSEEVDLPETYPAGV